MDKYEYQLKTEHIRQVAARKEYGEAAKLCDTIGLEQNPRRKNADTAADVYTGSRRDMKRQSIFCSRHMSMQRWTPYRVSPNGACIEGRQL